MKRTVLLLILFSTRVFAECVSWPDGSVTCPGTNPINGFNNDGYIDATDIHGNQYHGWEDQGIAGQSVYSMPRSPPPPNPQYFIDDSDDAPAAAFTAPTPSIGYSQPVTSDFHAAQQPDFRREEQLREMEFARERAEREAILATQQQSASAAANPFDRFVQPQSLPPLPPGATLDPPAPVHEAPTVIPTLDLSHEQQPDWAKIEKQQQKPKCEFKTVMTDDEIALCRRN